MFCNGFITDKCDLTAILLILNNDEYKAKFG